MVKTLYLWASEADFKRGECDRVYYHDGAVRLDAAQCGFFVAEQAQAEPFTQLAACVNADTPEGTSVELEVRILADGVWSDWLSLGTWSTFNPKGSAAPAAGASVRVENGVAMLEDGKSATGFAVRVRFASRIGDWTPTLRLLSVSLRGVRRTPALGDETRRTLPLPAYSALVRDPALACMDAPTVLTMLVNRRGEDLLPEELAQISYDNTIRACSNLAFLCAAAGSLGYPCYPLFTDVETLKKEVRAGYPFAALLHYPGEERPRLVAVHGFETDDAGAQTVLLHDPMAASDADAPRTLPLESFAALWEGLAIFLHEKESAPTLCPPYRVAGTLAPAEVPGEYGLYLRGDRTSLPATFTEDGGTVCFAVSGECAVATTAHKRFFYTAVSAAGNLVLPVSDFPAGTRIAVYIIGRTGKCITADLRL